MDRRDFLQSLAALTAGMLATPDLLGQTTATDDAARDALGAVLPRRLLGKTGKKVTMLGVGGWHIGRMSDKQARATIDAAIDGGVRFFDNAASYADGGSEKKYGRFLVPKYRDHVFIMTKTLAKDAEAAQKGLDASLKRLNTDYLDLWQMHALESPHDVNQRLAGGVLDYMHKAKDQGKVRHIGFTGHHEPAAHLQMLAKTDTLETVQMPVNAFDPSHESFIRQVLPKLVEGHYAPLAMKTLANGRFFRPYQHSGREVRLIPDRLTVEEAEHFVWSLPVSVLIAGPDNVQQMKEKIRFARSFAGMSRAERRRIIRKVADLVDENIEYYKA